MNSSQSKSKMNKLNIQVGNINRFKMNRRQWLKLSLVGSITLVSGGTWLVLDSNDEPLTLNTVIEKIEKMSLTNLVSSGEWTASKIFSHCAQSIEYSMSGYPEHKSELFKNTLGKVVFSLFSSRGKMTHSLNEPIPGGTQISDEQNFNIGLTQLKSSMMKFQNFNGDLTPHFAYGVLSKKQYESAHVMHIYDHLQQITIQS